MNDVVIRDGGPEDFASAFAVWRAAETARRGAPIGSVTGERVHGYARRTGAFLFVADAAGEVMGMSLATPATSRPRGLCVIQMVFVVPERWGGGIGGRLLDATLAEAGSRGCERAQLWSHSDDPRAEALYSSRALARSGHRVSGSSAGRSCATSVSCGTFEAAARHRLYEYEHLCVGRSDAGHASLTPPSGSEYDVPVLIPR